MKKIKIGIVDDEALFRKGLKLILKDYKDIKVIFDIGDGDSLFNLLEKKEFTPDIILLDLKMKGQSGIDIAKILTTSSPDIKIIILSTYYSDTFLQHMFEIGVNAYLPKNSNPDQVIKVIRSVSQKGFYFSEYTFGIIRAGLAEKNPNKQKVLIVPHITLREQEILKLICDQFTNHEIAHFLGISKRTVEGHRKRLLEKTGVRNMAGLIVYAIYNGLVDIDMESIIY